MKKDYHFWHDKKSSINDIKKPPYFYEKEIWYCHLGLNVGFEQDGRGKDFLRPVVIIRKFNNEIFWGIPLTRTDRNGKYYFRFSFKNNIEISNAILSQIKLIDARRLSHKIGDINDSDFKSLKQKLKALLP